MWYTTLEMFFSSSVYLDVCLLFQKQTTYCMTCNAYVRPCCSTTAPPLRQPTHHTSHLMVVVVVRVKRFLFDFRDEMTRTHHGFSSGQGIKIFRWVVALASPQHAYKLFVVGDHNQLKIFLFRPSFNNGAQRFAQPTFVFVVQICRRFVQRQNPTIDTKRFRQCHSDDQGGQLFLTVEGETGLKVEVCIRC